MNTILQILTIIITSLGWALLASMTICHTVLLMSCLMSSIWGEDKITFCASGHIRAYLITLSICWIIVLLVRFITT